MSGRLPTVSRSADESRCQLPQEWPLGGRVGKGQHQVTSNSVYSVLEHMKTILSLQLLIMWFIKITQLQF